MYTHTLSWRSPTQPLPMEWNRREVFEKLASLRAGANPNIALLSGETALMAASRAGKPPVVELLLAKGANPDARGPRAQTALMWAVAQKHAEVVRLLVARGAGVHARTESWAQMMAVPPHGFPEYNRMIPHGADTASCSWHAWAIWRLRRCSSRAAPT